jgi:hypothetical protein
LKGSLPASGDLALLDETSFEILCRDSDALDRLRRPAESLDGLTLPPYAVVRLTAST